MKRLIVFIFKLLLKNKAFAKSYSKSVRTIAIAFNQYITVYCNKNGFPKKGNGTSMNFHELYDHFLTSDQFKAYKDHAARQ